MVAPCESGERLTFGGLCPLPPGVACSYVRPRHTGHGKPGPPIQKRRERLDFPFHLSTTTSFERFRAFSRFSGMQDLGDRYSSPRLRRRTRFAPTGRCHSIGLTTPRLRRSSSSSCRPPTIRPSHPHVLPSPLLSPFSLAAPERLARAAPSACASFPPPWRYVFLSHWPRQSRVRREPSDCAWHPSSLEDS